MLTLSFIQGAWSYWRERPAWKHGHWEHLDVTHETSASARGLSEVFHIGDITKVGQRSSLTVPTWNSSIGNMRRQFGSAGRAHPAQTRLGSSPTATSESFHPLKSYRAHADT